MHNSAAIMHKEGTLGAYLYWNGGLDTVKPLLKVTEMTINGQLCNGFNSKGAGVTQLCTVANNCTHSSARVVPNTFIDDFTPGNGLYIVQGWDIIERIVPTNYQESDTHNNTEMLYTINSRQPERHRVPLSVLAADRIVDYSTILTGSLVYAITPPATQKLPQWELYKTYEIHYGEQYGYTVAVKKHPEGKTTYYHTNSDTPLYIHNEKRFQELCELDEALNITKKLRRWPSVEHSPDLLSST